MEIEYLSKKLEQEELNGQILSITEDLNGKLIFLFECDDWITHEAIRTFKVTCINVVENTVNPSYTDDIYFTNDHPILWLYNEPHGALYYSSQPKNKHELLGFLWEAHDMIFKELKPISYFINYSIREDGSLFFVEGKNGLLARGPKKLLKKYQEKIGRYLATNYVSSYKPDNNHKALLIDEGYIICDTVTIEEIKS